MRVVDVAQLRPGVCVLSGSARGPFIDLLRELTPNPAGGRAYVTVRMAQELGVAAGLMPLEHSVALVENLAEANEEIARLAAVEAEHLRLIESVGYTLKHGAISRRNEVALRPVPGKPRVAV
jgi:hypothetical protein